MHESPHINGIDWLYNAVRVAYNRYLVGVRIFRCAADFAFRFANRRVRQFKKMGFGKGSGFAAQTKTKWGM